MKGYAERYYFTELDLEIYSLARKYVEYLPQPLASSGEWRCHEVARAVHHVLDDGGYGVALVDGTYSGVDHSWIWLNLPSEVILDVYAIGALPMVQLRLRCGSDYKVGELRDDIRTEIVDVLIEYIYDGIEKATEKKNDLFPPHERDMTVAEEYDDFQRRLGGALSCIPDNNIILDEISELRRRSDRAEEKLESALAVTKKLQVEREGLVARVDAALRGIAEAKG